MQNSFKFIHSPFSLIPRVLSKVQQDLCVTSSALVDMPNMVSYATSSADRTSSTTSTIEESYDSTGEPHPLRHQIHLAVWPVSGESSRIKAFQKTLVRSSSNPGPQELKNNTTNPGESGLAGVIDGCVIFFKHL